MKRCLIVDDSSVIRKVVKRILDGWGMLVTEAATGHEALALCAGDMPDIIIVETHLTDMAVEDFVRQTTAIQAPEKPAIVISMIEFDVGAIMRAKRAGARGYILKPFDRQQLLERFRDMELAAA